MSYITSFMDGESYGSEDINKVVSRFVTSGIEDPFIDGEPYNVRRLNDLSKPVTTRGVIGSESNAMQVIKVGEEFYISPGTAFFGNGSTLEVTENEPILLSDFSSTNYVYLVSSEEENRNYIAVNTSEPDITDENIVMLCEIASDGTITDRRCYATGKLRGLYQDNEFAFKSIRIQDTVTFDEDIRSTVINHDLECSDFRMMVLVCWGRGRIDENGDYVSPDYNGEFNLGLTDTDNSVILWLPHENLYLGLCAKSNRNEYSFYYPIYSEAVYNARKYFMLEENYYLIINHIERNTWEFSYLRTSSIYKATKKFDFKLFYI